MQGVNANLKDSSSPIYFTINGVDNDYMAEYNYYQALTSIENIIEEEILCLESDFEREEREAKEAAEKKAEEIRKFLKRYENI